ncbi:hypothetical protein ILYODFUR_005173, partial [Ilyodon furcidens]
DQWAQWDPGDHLAPQEHLAHKVSKAAQERPESLDKLALWVPVALLDLLENPEMMVNQVNQGNQVTVDPPDLRELVVSQELLVCRASRDTEVIQVLTVQREKLVLLVLRVRLVRQARAAHLDPWDRVVCLGSEDVPDPLELLVHVVMMACLVLLVLQVQLVQLELRASLDLLDQRVKLVLPAPVALREPRDPVESLALLGHLDRLVPLVTLVLMVSLDQKAQQVLQVLQVLLVSPDLAGLLDLRERLDLLGQKEQLETQVFQDSRERLDPKEKLARQALREPLARKEKKAREDPEVSLVLLDLLDLQEKEELLVTVVSLVRMVLLVRREPLVSADPLGPVVQRGPLVTLAVPESLDFLVQGV